MAKNRTKIVETRIKDLGLIERRRRQIAEGAMKVFITKGFDKATVREIAEAAGLTMGSMYNYVRTKEDIIYVVYDFVTSALREDMIEAISRVDDPKQQLEVALRHNLKAINQRWDQIRLLYQESGSLDRDSLHDVLARETQYIEMFEDCIRKSLGGRKASEFKIKLAADILSYMPVIVTLRRWSLSRRFDSMEDVLEGILDFSLQGIRFLLEEDGAGQSKVPDETGD